MNLIVVECLIKMIWFLLSFNFDFGNLIVVGHSNLIITSNCVNRLTVVVACGLLHEMMEYLRVRKKSGQDILPTI